MSMPHQGNHNDGTCLLLFAGNMLLNVVAAVGVLSFLQGVALVSSIVASIYVSIDHHKKIKWKKAQSRKPPAPKGEDGGKEHSGSEL